MTHKLLTSVAFVTSISFLSLANTCIAGDAEGLIEKAEKLRLESKSLGFEWNTTRKLLAKAKEAFENDDLKLAEELANSAIKQAKYSIEQAKYADAHWQDDLPK